MYRNHIPEKERIFFERLPNENKENRENGEDRL